MLVDETVSPSRAFQRLITLCEKKYFLTSFWHLGLLSLASGGRYFADLFPSGRPNLLSHDRLTYRYTRSITINYWWRVSSQFQRCVLHRLRRMVPLDHEPTPIRGNKETSSGVSDCTWRDRLCGVYTLKLVCCTHDYTVDSVRHLSFRTYMSNEVIY